MIPMSASVGAPRLIGSLLEPISIGLPALAFGIARSVSRIPCATPIGG